MNEPSDMTFATRRNVSGRAIGIFAALVGLTGCAVGPNYKQPKVAMPENYSPVLAQATPVRPAETRWWQTFNDAMLNALILDASHSSLDLQAAAARVREARALRAGATAGYWPTANATASYTRSKSGSSGFSSGSSGLNSNQGSGERDLYQAGFDAAWELDVFGGVQRSVEASTAQLQAAQADYQNVLITLYGEIARNYVDLRGFQRAIQIAQDNARAQQETLGLTRTRYRAGLTSDLDVARAEAQVATTLSQIPTLQTQATAAAHRLAVLTGKEPTALLDQLAQPKRIPEPPPEVPVGLPSELLRRRPDIRSAERNLAAETAFVGVATADLFPRFTLNGDIGFRASDVNRLFNSNSLAWGIGPGINWNIFSAGRTRANIQAQEARVDQAVANYKFTILTALEDVQNALVAYQNDQVRSRALASAVQSNQRAVNLAQQLYQRGLADFLNVLQAQLNLFVAQDQLVRSYTQVSNDVVALYKSLGGGWEQPPLAATQPTQVAPATQPIPWVTTSFDLPTSQPASPIDAIHPAPRPAPGAITPATGPLRP
jgi:NodT family efflux transporter outer membrane factor (OMF) lipoprotein